MRRQQHWLWTRTDERHNDYQTLIVAGDAEEAAHKAIVTLFADRKSTNSVHLAPIRLKRVAVLGDPTPTEDTP